MSIQSSVNALIGSIGAVVRARDMTKMRQAELSLAQQRQVHKEQSLKHEQKKLETKQFRAETERKLANLAVRQQREKEKKDGTKAL